MINESSASESDSEVVKHENKKKSHVINKSLASDDEVKEKENLLEE